MTRYYVYAGREMLYAGLDRQSAYAIYERLRMGEDPRLMREDPQWQEVTINYPRCPLHPDRATQWACEHYLG